MLSGREIYAVRRSILAKKMNEVGISGSRLVDVICRSESAVRAACRRLPLDPAAAAAPAAAAPAARPAASRNAASRTAAQREGPDKACDAARLRLVPLKGRARLAQGTLRPYRGSSSLPATKLAESIQRGKTTLPLFRWAFFHSEVL